MDDKDLDKRVALLVDKAMKKVAAEMLEKIMSKTPVTYKERKVNCGRCGEEFSSPFELMRHLGRTKSNCVKKDPLKLTPKTSSIIIHPESGANMYKCSLCSSVFGVESIIEHVCEVSTGKTKEDCKNKFNNVEFPKTPETLEKNTHRFLSKEEFEENKTEPRKDI